MASGVWKILLISLNYNVLLNSVVTFSEKIQKDYFKKKTHSSLFGGKNGEQKLEKIIQQIFWVSGDDNKFEIAENCVEKFFFLIIRVSATNSLRVSESFYLQVERIFTVFLPNMICRFLFAAVECWF